MGGVSFFRQRATSTGTFSKLQNDIYLYKLLSFRSTEPIWVTLYTYHQSNNDVTPLQSILDKVYNSPSELHLVENWGSVFLSTTHHFHRHLLQATKNITLQLLYTIKNNQFVEGAIHTAITWIGLNLIQFTFVIISE